MNWVVVGDGQDEGGMVPARLIFYSTDKHI